MKGDNWLLKVLLSNQAVTANLPNLVELAKDSSAQPGPSDAYRALTRVFCDGFEVNLGLVKKELVS